MVVLNNGGGVSQGYLEWSLAYVNRFHIVDEKLSKLEIIVTWPSYHVRRSMHLCSSSFHAQVCDPSDDTGIYQLYTEGCRSSK